MTWKKGQSGNPTGRPKEYAEVRTLARAESAEAIKTLATIMRSKKELARTRVAAAEALLNRAWGKPTQPVADGSDDELRALFPTEIVIRGPK